MMRLRPATAADLPFAYEVKKAAFREYVELVWGWDEDEQVGLHRRRFGEQEVRIVNWEGVDVGFLSIQKTPDCIKLNQLFILPEYQGRGIGAECMRSIEAGSNLPIRLGVLKANPRAADFYLRLGYRETGQSETHRLFEKRLAPAQLHHKAEDEEE